MRIPLHIKLMATYILVVGLVLVPSFVYLRQTLQTELRRVVVRGLEQETAQLRDRLAEASAGELAATVGALARVMPARVTVVDPSGRVVGDSVLPAQGMENHATRPEIRQALASGVGVASRRSSTTGAQLYYVAMRFPRVGPARGVVRLSRPLSEVDDAVVNAFRFVNRAGALALSAAVLLSLLAAVVASRPLRRIATGVRAYVAGDFGHQIDVHSDDEIGDAARSLRELGAQLRARLLALGADRATLTALLDELPVGVVLYDAARVPTLVNAEARVLCELRPETESARAMQLPTLEGHAEASARVLASGSPETLPLTPPWLPRARLKARWIALYGHDGGRHLSVILTDATLARRLDEADAALAQAALQLRNAASASASVAVDAMRASLLAAAEQAESALPGRLAPARKIDATELGPLCAGAVADVRDRAAAHGVRLELGLFDATVAVVESAGRARQAVRALLAQAVDEAEPGALVRVRIDVHDAVARLAVRLPAGALAAARVADLAELVHTIGGEAGLERQGDLGEAWIALPRA